jgi:predicted nucleotidyltransferase
LQLGNRVLETPLTDYDQLRTLIGKYNASVSKGLHVDPSIVDIRDALSHGVYLRLIERVILFGSLVAGIPTPRSDADLLVILRESDRANPRDRIPEILQAMSPAPCPLDLFVATKNEVASETAGLVAVALSTGIDLLDQSPLPGSGS